MTDINHAHKRIDDIETKVNSHTEQLKSMQGMLKQNSESLHENTLLTKDIANNTAELVELFKGAKTFRKFVLWASPIVIALVSLWVWAKSHL